LVTLSRIQRSGRKLDEKERGVGENIEGRCAATEVLHFNADLQNVEFQYVNRPPKYQNVKLSSVRMSKRQNIDH
jgi:hypothetical protein